MGERHCLQSVSICASCNWRYNNPMSIQEIEKAIEGLSPGEFDSLVEWIAGFRAHAETGYTSGTTQSLKPTTLADALGDLIGSVGNDMPAAGASSRNAGQAFTDHLIVKKREHRL